MMLMCISGGLEGLKTKNVENVIVFKAFLEVRPSDKPSNRASRGEFDVENGIDVHKWWLGWLENQKC